MKTLFSCRRFAVVIGLLLVSSAYATPTPFGVIHYLEEGQWFVQLFTKDADGWPDTLEKRVFASEAGALARIRELTHTLGVTETDIHSSEVAGEIQAPFTGEIWEAPNEWSEEWEKNYSTWVRQNFDDQFFVKYGIKTDCADAAVALRWIYSRFAGLPAGNTLAWGGGLMTNRSVRSIWKTLPTADNWYEDQRFLAALDYLLVNTYTHSLDKDGYPIEISPKRLAEGTFHLEMREVDGHTRVVSRIERDNGRYPITDLYSNVPRKVRSLYEEPFTVSQQPKLLLGGFKNHRWLKISGTTATLVPAADMPGYSLEQYQPEFFTHGVPDFSAEVVSRFQESFDPVLALEAIFKNLKSGVKDRKKVVEEGYKACQKEDCSPGTAGYENWSTPSRDERLLGYFTQIQMYLKALTGDDLDRFTRAYEGEKSRKYVKIAKKKLRFRDIEALWTTGKYSSDPKESLARRWGI